MVFPATAGTRFVIGIAVYSHQVPGTKPMPHVATELKRSAQDSGFARCISDSGSLQDAASRVSPLERFLNAFLQERNIQWMLIIGAAIVFGSSLMLVTNHWTSWPALPKYFTILGYTAAIFTAAEVGRRRLGLEATGQVLHLLTLMLMPVSFFALHWLTAGTATQNALGMLAVLSGIAFLGFCSTRILDLMLGARQTTFLVSYQLLSVAGMLPPAESAGAAMVLMSALWMVFTMGVVKVNRHAFWMAEEHRRQPVFGFLPIALLGLQFLTLVGFKAVAAIPLQWIGLACVMVSATVLLTARSVADVFRQRTGDLIRPLPWTIAIPLFAGVVLTAVGVCVSFSGFHLRGPTTYAVVPTTAIAACLMWIAARDTKHEGFVWLSLIFAMCAYQSSPTLFADVVAALKRSAEAALQERQLPLAFYGLTYLPFLSVVALSSQRFARRSDTAFSRPMQHLVTIVVLVLFAAAFSHVKAAFVVSLVNVAVFMALAAVFGDRRYAVVSILAAILATASVFPFLTEMGVWTASAGTCMAALAALGTLMTATRFPDELLQRIPIVPGGGRRILARADGTDRNICQLTGCLMAGLISVVWFLSRINDIGEPMTGMALLQFGLLMVAFVLYTLRNPHYLSGMAVCVFAAFELLCETVGRIQISWDSFVHLCGGISVVAASASAVCYGLVTVFYRTSDKHPLRELRHILGAGSGQTPLPLPGQGIERRLRTFFAFVVPLCDLSLVVLSGLAILYHLPSLVVSNLCLILPSANAIVLATPVATGVTVIWLLLASAVFRSRVAAHAGCAVLPLWVSAAVSTLIPLTGQWLPAIWAISSALPFTLGLRPRLMNSPSVRIVGISWLQLILLGSCFSLSLPIRLAAFLAMGGIVLGDWYTLTKSKRTYLAVMGNIQILLLAVNMGGIDGFVLSALSVSESLLAGPCLCFAASLSVLLFDQAAAAGRCRPSSRSEHDQQRDTLLDPITAQVWSALLRAGLVLLAGLSLFAHWDEFLFATLMVGSFAMIVVAEIRQAVLRQQEFHVWSACCVTGFAFFWLMVHNVIPFGAGISQYVLLTTSIMALIISELTGRHPRLQIVSRPLLRVGQFLPVCVAVMAILRQLLDFQTMWLGANSLAMLISAGICFHQGIRTRKRRFFILAVGILNLSLMLLWQSLAFTDPQFFMIPMGLSVLAFVELLRKEIPVSAHDPMRYAGALLILVSPLFNILDAHWVHMLSLMAWSVLVIMLAIGLRLRALVYAGSAFLAADLFAMVVRSTIDHPGLLWIGGVAIGGTVIALAAVCENHREKLLARIRQISSELATWR